ncbi:gpW family head-tail joining protein [Acidocella sp.]|uniref:gpW family head-tail joining protein n=1 Tax=Acidocella sp. TaxID=50710 RepID=UPI002610D32F|nr:gpW family head-tail joining protein [Acidocella sp.]
MSGAGRSYNPSTSVFAGMTTAQLQTALANAQTALIELQTGAKAVTLSYTQGDGTKSVTYSPASASGLVMLIKQLQAQLGIVCHPRRPLNFRFR